MTAENGCRSIPVCRQAGKRLRQMVAKNRGEAAMLREITGIRTIAQLGALNEQRAAFSTLFDSQFSS